VNLTMDDELAGNKQKRNKHVTPLPCSRHQFVYLSEEMLAFHAWYKFGDPPITPMSVPEDMDEVLLAIRKLIASITTYCPREEGNGWDLQKLHEMLHIPMNLWMFQHSANTNAGHGKRLLKHFFKHASITSQQHGPNVFIRQVAQRVQTHRMLSML